MIRHFEGRNHEILVEIRDIQNQTGASWFLWNHKDAREEAWLYIYLVDGPQIQEILDLSLNLVVLLRQTR